MKYFLVEGNIIDAGRMTDGIMNEHMAYTRAAMERGMTFMSGLKADMSGGISIMRVEDADALQAYLTMNRFLSMVYRNTGWLSLTFII